MSSRRLSKSDCLLGVHDAYRVGALRFRLNDSGEFLGNQHGVAAPPFVKLRALEAASKAIESDEENTAPAGEEWLRMLIAPRLVGWCTSEGQRCRSREPTVDC
jgi:serine/threonine-protein kinase HipA